MTLCFRTTLRNATDIGRRLAELERRMNGPDGCYFMADYPEYWAVPPAVTLLRGIAAVGEILDPCLTGLETVNQDALAALSREVEAAEAILFETWAVELLSKPVWGMDDEVPF